MMLTLVFLRFIGEKYDDGVEKLRQTLISEGLDPNDENIVAAFFDDATFTDGTYNLPVEARWSTVINTPAPDRNAALDETQHSHHLGEEADSSFTNDQHKGIYFDYVMANGRNLRNREKEILFMDLRQWTENPVKNEQKKKVTLLQEQIERAAGIYHTWQDKGTDGASYAVPELYRSVGFEEIKGKGFALTPSKYIEFIDHDLEIDYAKEMSRIQQEMKDILTAERQSQKMLEDAFKGIGYGIE